MKKIWSMIAILCLFITVFAGCSIEEESKKFDAAAFNGKWYKIKEEFSALSCWPHSWMKIDTQKNGADISFAFHFGESDSTMSESAENNLFYGQAEVIENIAEFSALTVTAGNGYLDYPVSCKGKLTFTSDNTVTIRIQSSNEPDIIAAETAVTFAFLIENNEDAAFDTARSFEESFVLGDTRGMEPYYMGDSNEFFEMYYVDAKLESIAYNAQQSNPSDKHYVYEIYYVITDDYDTGADVGKYHTFLSVDYFDDSSGCPAGYYVTDGVLGRKVS